MDITIREAAKLLNCTAETLYQWIKEKGLPARHVNEHYRFHPTELLEWAAAHGIEISPQLFPRTARQAQSATLAKALQAGGIVYDLPGRDQHAVLQALVDQLPLPADVDREFLLRMLLAREELGSTGIGGGVAIPHVRNPIVLRVRTPLVALAFLQHPVDFHAADGQPVTILFSLISPTVRVHLSLLSRLASALHDAALRQSLVQRGHKEEILNHFLRIEAGFWGAASAPSGHRENA